MKLNTLKLFLILALIVSTIALKAQIIYIGVGGGGGTFQMNSVKEFNQSIVNQLPFTPVVKDNFPPYFFFKGEVICALPKNLSLGIDLSTTSTGSRFTLADYSGKYTLDNIQNGFFTGLKLLYGNGAGYLKGFNISLESGTAFSKMMVNEDLKVGQESQKDNMDFSAMGFFVQPGLCYYLDIGSKVKVCANVSYYFGIEKGYHLPGERKQILLDQDSRIPIKPQWDGIRVGITAYLKWGTNSK
ncbi:MAG: hypothetical protein Q8908_10435 [Bacteroidota bacterium]|nr:hypothetical protein [Bacteroidota bacterium]